MPEKNACPIVKETLIIVAALLRLPHPLAHELGRNALSHLLGPIIPPIIANELKWERHQLQEYMKLIAAIHTLLNTNRPTEAARTADAVSNLIDCEPRMAEPESPGEEEAPDPPGEVNFATG